ncbi:MAG: glutamine synthetase, partial [Planctomycetota bacterium]
AFAVMLRAGLDGIKGDLMPPEAIEENIYSLDDESIAGKKIDVLPGSLEQALYELKKDPLMRDVLGDHLFERYVDVKTKEWDEFKQQVTSWELETYLDIF